MRRPALLAAVLSWKLQAATVLFASVWVPKAGRAVTGLTTADFKASSTILSVTTAPSKTHRIMLLADTSLVGAAVQPAVIPFIENLPAGDQMALAGFHATADLLQEFTESKPALIKAAETMKFANSPRLLDALYAAITDAFRNDEKAAAIILLSAGIEGPSRIEEAEVLQLAAKKGIAIFPVSIGPGRNYLLDQLALQTGGVSFRMKEIRKGTTEKVHAVYEAIRSGYLVTVEDAASTKGPLQLEIVGQSKLRVSSRTQN